MSSPLSALIDRFKSLPPAQQAMLGVGVPVVAGAAIYGNMRGKPAAEGAAATVEAAGAPLEGPQQIGYGAGLDDLFGLQSLIGQVQTDLTKRIDALGKRSPAGGTGKGSGPSPATPTRAVNQVADDTNFVKVATTPSPTGTVNRNIGRRPAVGAAEATAATVAAPRATSPRTPSRFPVAPRKVAPRPALKAPARKVAPRPALKAPARKVAPRPALKAPARKVKPRPALKAPARKVAPRPALKAPARKVKPRVKFL